MKISIITVCLNSEKTIERTIQSVIGQKDKNFEYIIVDGKSTDKTLEVIEKYQKDISAIISEPDRGIYDAMNKGIALATGDIIGIINSDDWYEPGVFKMVRDCFQKSDAGVVYSKMNLIGENGEITVQTPTDIERIRYEMQTPHPTVFVKRRIYEQYGAFQLKYRIAADYDLMLRLYTGGVGFYYCDEVFANFKLGGTAMRNWRKCVEEALEISQGYLPCTPLAKRQYFKSTIMHIYKMTHFEKMMQDEPDNLLDILTKKLGMDLKDNVAVFGAGKWGTDVCKILLDRGVCLSYIVDNDSRKWGRKVEGIEVLRPEILKTFQGVLLVAVKDFCDEIVLQIKEMHSLELYYITWKEIAAEYIKMFKMKL